MEIVLLGTGTAIPASHHSSAGLVVSTRETTLLVDAGPGTVARFSEAGFSIDDLDTLLITHLHSDHTLDLATLLQVFDSTPNPRRIRPFKIIGCHGTQEYYSRLLEAYPSISPESYKVKVTEVGKSQFMIGDLHLRSALSGHTPSSVGYRFVESGSVFVYSGDAVPHSDLDTLSANADVLVCECSFPAGWDTPDHMNADMVGMLAERAGVKKLIITHRYPPALEVDLKAQIQKYYSGNVVLAEDGMRFKVGA